MDDTYLENMSIGSCYLQHFKKTFRAIFEIRVASQQTSGG